MNITLDLSNYSVNQNILNSTYNTITFNTIFASVLFFLISFKFFLYLFDNEKVKKYIDFKRFDIINYVLDYFLIILGLIFYSYTHEVYFIAVFLVGIIPSFIIGLYRLIMA